MPRSLEQYGQNRCNWRGEDIFVSWILPYGIPIHIQKNNVVQTSSKLLASLNTMLSAKHLTITSYNPRTNDRVENHVRSVVTRLRQNVAETKETGTTSCNHLRLRITGKCTSPMGFHPSPWHYLATQQVSQWSTDRTCFRATPISRKVPEPLDCYCIVRSTHFRSK